MCIVICKNVNNDIRNGTYIKRLIFVVFTAFFYLISVRAQTEVKHIMDRGETLSSIAEKYSVTKEDIIKLNPHVAEFVCVGMELYIPIKSKGSNQQRNSLVNSDVYNAYFQECQIAYKFFESKKYKKAQKQYERILNKYKSVLDCEDAYYSYALCSYNRGKWKSAIRDLSFVAENRDFSSSIRTHCSSLLAKAKKNREEQLDNRANAWGNLFVTAASIGASMAVASSNSTCSGSYSGSATNVVPKDLGSMSNQQFDSYVKNSLNSMAKQTMIHTSMQMKQEEMQVKNNFIATYRQIHGKYPTDEEVQNAYYRYIEARGNAAKAVQQSTISSYSSGKSDNNLKSTSSSSSRCGNCINGVCSKCNGKGKYYDTGFGNPHWVDPCVVCGGNGKCPSCGGRGYR